MPDRQQAVLRVEPHQISALRAAFLDAGREIGHQLAELRRKGQIPEPWLATTSARTSAGSTTPTS